MELSQVLSVEQSDQPTKLYFTFEGRCCSCLLVQESSSGVLLCIPYDGIDIGHFHTAEANDYAELLGPFMEFSVVAATAQGKPSKRLLDVLLFDFDINGVECLSALLPADCNSEDVGIFGIYRGTPEWPHAKSLRERAAEFLRAGGDRLEGYVTAAEAPIEPELPDGAGGADTQTLLEQLLSQAEITQRAVHGMKDQIAGVSKLEARLEKLWRNMDFLQPPAIALQLPMLLNSLLAMWCLWMGSRRTGFES